MIASLKRAIVHILDANSGVSVYSEEELDVTDASINSFITKHIEKVFEDASMRNAEFSENSGFKYHLAEYIKDENYFITMSKFIAQRVYEGVTQSDKPDSSDLIVCDCMINERPLLAVLKCENKIGYTHQVLQDDGKVKNQIIIFQLNISVKSVKSTVKQPTLSQMYCLNVFMIFLQENP